MSTAVEKPQVKVKCPMCGAVTYKPSVETILREVEELWEPWQEFLTEEQRELLKKCNNPTRLETILAKQGYLKMFCPLCIFTASMEWMSEAFRGG